MLQHTCCSRGLFSSIKLRVPTAMAVRHTLKGAVQGVEGLYQKVDFTIALLQWHVLLAQIMVEAVVQPDCASTPCTAAEANASMPARGDLFHLRASTSQH